MKTNSEKLVNWLKNLKDEVVTGNPVINTDKHRAVVNAIIQSGKSINVAISAAKLYPQCVDIPALTIACSRYNPELVDSMLQVPGVDRTAIERSIIGRQHPLDVLTRLNNWYPNEVEFSVQSQRAWAAALQKNAMTELSTDSVYQRRLSTETGKAIEAGLGYIGNKIQDQEAATVVLRSAHLVLKGITKLIPVLNSLENNFSELALSKMWSYALTQKENAVEWLLNAQSFTATNIKSFPDVLAWLDENHPQQVKAMAKILEKDAKDQTLYFKENRERYAISSDVTKTSKNASVSDLLRKKQLSIIEDDFAENLVEELTPDI